MRTLGEIGTIVEAISNGKLRATRKGIELARRISAVARVKAGDLDIEISGLTAIPGGIQYYVRAWDAAGGQVGFGPDGSVEYERFRVFNPPVLIPDGTTSTTVDENGDEVITPNYKEAPVQALLADLRHTLTSIQKSGPENLVPGKRGSTVSTFYPEASGGSSSTDGYVTRTPTSETWATIISGAGSTAVSNSASANALQMTASTTLNQWSIIRRGVFVFDTSALPDTDTVVSAIFSIKATSKSDTLVATPGIALTNVTTTPINTLAASDYSGVGSTRYATDITYAAYSTSVYNDFTLNSTGISAVSKTGQTRFGLKFSYDIDATSPTWVSGLASTANVQFADVAGTVSDPKLVITHTSPPGGTGTAFLVF